MEVVAQHLRSHALHLAAGEDADLFGRSAFNRFYYSAYLLTKKDLQPVLPAIPAQHASIPDFLRSVARGEIAAVKKAAMRAEDHQLVQLCSVAQQAANGLADLLGTGYSTRVVADYRPDISVIFSAPAGFQLNSVDVSEAQSWPHRTRLYTRAILAALK